MPEGPDSSRASGERIGTYRIIRRLATGGTSEVLLAKAEGPQGFERSVVLKILLPEYNHDDESRALFAREATAYARLSHPSIVRLNDFFEHDGQLVMVLEFVDGPPLSRLRGMLKSVGQRFDDATALFVAGSLFEALAAAHAATNEMGEPAPVIHRDVNPANVLIRWDGLVKLADFGIAKVTGATHQSSAGLIRGTYGYMAPEQVKGETVTPRADVYAGAIILWEMLTKGRAFTRGAKPDIVVLRELSEPRIASIDLLRPDLDRTLREAVKRALEPRHEKRNITAEEMVSTLRLVVPEAVGRDMLVKALASVRHEPKPAATSMPPPMLVGPPNERVERVRAMSPARPGALPKIAPAVRRAPDSVRKLGLNGAVPAAPAPASKTASLDGVPRPSSSGASPDVPEFASVVEPPSAQALRNASRGAVVPGNGAQELTAAPPEVHAPSGRSPGTLRLGTTRIGLAPASAFDSRVEQVARDLPSRIPPNVFPRTDPPAGLSEALDAPTREDLPKLAPLAPRDGNEPESVTIASATSLLRAASIPIEAAPPVDLDATLVMEQAELKARVSRPELVSSPGSGLEPLVPPMPSASSPTALSHAENARAVEPLPTVASTTQMTHRRTPRPGLHPPARPVRARFDSRSLLLLLALGLAFSTVAMVGSFGYGRWKNADTLGRVPPERPLPRSAATVASPLLLATAPQDAPAPSALSQTQPESPKPAVPASAERAVDVPPGSGRVKTTGTTAGRRIFVDDRTVGQTPDSVVVKCGARRIRLGSAGSTQAIEVPCGGETTVADR